MAQTMYAHMNKWEKREKLKKISWQPVAHACNTCEAEMRMVWVSVQQGQTLLETPISKVARVKRTAVWLK
jgi:hypothetical protein